MKGQERERGRDWEQELSEKFVIISIPKWQHIESLNQIYNIISISLKYKTETDLKVIKDNQVLEEFCFWFSLVRKHLED